MPFEGQDLFISRGKLALVFGVDTFCGGHEVAAAVVVAETFPEFEDELFGRGGQVCTVGMPTRIFRNRPIPAQRGFVEVSPHSAKSVGIFFPLPGHLAGIWCWCILAAFEQTGPFLHFLLFFLAKAMVTVYALAKMSILAFALGLRPILKFNNQYFSEFLHHSPNPLF